MGRALNLGGKIHKQNIFFPWLSRNIVPHFITQPSFPPAPHHPLIHCVSSVRCWLPFCYFLRCWPFMSFLADWPDLAWRTPQLFFPNFFSPTLLYKMSSIPLMPQLSLIPIFSPILHHTDRWESATKGSEIYQPTL